MNKLLFILFSFMILSTDLFGQSSFKLISNGSSDYVIEVKQDEVIYHQAAEILQNYVYLSTGVKIPIVKKNQSKRKFLICFGCHGEQVHSERFSIQMKRGNLYFDGLGRGVVYGVYRFIENVIGARKWYVGTENTDVPSLKEIVINADYKLSSSSPFYFREVYFPIEADQEYLDWYGLHNLEDLWGLWGHSFDKLLPAKEYFKSNPEYYSFYLGRRQPNQLCLSNPAVLKLVTNRMSELIKDNPEAEYWSISPNDDLGYCECDQCKKVDDKEGGPQGSLIHFVNNVAKNFPDKKFTTLAYTYSANPPLITAPLPNVSVILSSIDARRGKSLIDEPSASLFRSQLKRWKGISDNIFVWDYYTQFTNYLAPFPQWKTIGKNIKYFQDENVKGVFAQGSGHNYSHMAELKSYLLSKLLWNPSLNEEVLTEEFVKGYYGDAASDIMTYINSISDDIKSQNVKLDIYGNPIDNHKDFLNPERMDYYSTLFDHAEKKVAGNPKYLKRIQLIRLGYEYVYLQQAKFYGTEKHGLFEKVNNNWEIKPQIKRKVDFFLRDLEKFAIKEMAEADGRISDYEYGWQEVLNEGFRQNKAFQAKMHLKYPFVEDFPAKGLRTLTDGLRGTSDFSYNWLLFNDVNLESTITLDSPTIIHSIEANFLESPRQWIFRPESVTFYISEDGINFKEILEKRFDALEEDYTKSRIKVDQKFSPSKVVAIKVIAKPYNDLPAWRYHPRKKPNIAIDEIWIE